MNVYENNFYNRKLFMQSTVCQQYNGGAEFTYCRAYRPVSNTTPSPSGDVTVPHELTYETGEYSSTNCDTDLKANINVSATEHVTLWLNQQALWRNYEKETSYHAETESCGQPSGTEANGARQ